MQEILKYVNMLSIQDHIILWISLFFWIYFIFIWIEKVYKVYLWLILWLFVFCIISLTLTSLNPETWLNSMKDFFIKHREGLWLYSLILIPLFSILIPFNSSIGFRIRENDRFNYVVSFLFWFFYFSFFLTVFLSIINNRFLFAIDENIVLKLRSFSFIDSILAYFSTSIIFDFLKKFDYVINLFVIIFIFYKMTIGWIIDYLIDILFILLKKIVEKYDKKVVVKKQ